MTDMMRGQFRIVGKLGAGGMGEVSRAVDELLKRDVALKMLRPDLASEPEVVVRFRAEAITLARLDHPNIARLYGMSQDHDALFMVMEFVPGETLAALIRRRGRIPWSEAVVLMGQVLDAVEYAHSLDIVHRDLKPANIMLRPDGVVKVTDFGIARVLGTERATRLGQTIGTFLYMSPEQIRAEDVTPRSDLYSLGIVFYELLVGYPPYRGTETELIRQHLTAPVPSLVSLAGDVPLSFASVLHKALAKSPADRFPSAAVFRSELDRIARSARRAPVGPTRLAPSALAPTRLASPAVAPEMPPTRPVAEPGQKAQVIAGAVGPWWRGISRHRAGVAGVSVLVVILLVATVAVFRSGPRVPPSPVTGSQSAPATPTNTSVVAAPPPPVAIEPVPPPSTIAPRPESPPTRPDPPIARPPVRDQPGPARVPLEPPAVSNPTTPIVPPDVALARPRPAFPAEEVNDAFLIVVKDDESSEVPVLLRLTGDALIVYDPDLSKAIKTWPYAQIVKATYTQTEYRRPPLFIKKGLRYFLTLATAAESVKLRLGKDSLAKALTELERRTGVKANRAVGYFRSVEVDRWPRL